MLTEKQKWECVARWLNRACEEVTSPLKVDVCPCGSCPEFHGNCDCPPQVNFKVIEQFTGDGTVVNVNGVIASRVPGDISHADNLHEVIKDIRRKSPYTHLTAFQERKSR